MSGDTNRNTDDDTDDDEEDDKKEEAIPTLAACSASMLYSLLCLLQSETTTCKARIIFKCDDTNPFEVSFSTFTATASIALIVSSCWLIRTLI